MKDAQLKESLFKHFWKQRCFSQPEIDIYCTEGVSGNKKLITDIDVYALRQVPQFGFERILCDCKTLKGQSPINRALWLSGVVRFLDASSGCVLLDLPSIEPDHKLAASSQNITLLNRKDFGVYDKSVNFPEGSGDVQYGLAEVTQLKTIGKRFPRLEPLSNYLYRDAWREPFFGDLIRHTIAHIRSVASELDPSKTDHIALLCDACAIFSIGIAECCGTLFNQYLHPSEKSLLSDSLKVLIWGGKDQYELSKSLREKLLAARGVTGSGIEELELPEWNYFLQVVRNILERPGDAFKLPWLLRHLGFDILRSKLPLVEATVEDLLAVKYAMMVAEYICRASGAPREFQNHIVSLTVRIQTGLAEKRDRKVESTPMNATLAEAPDKIAEEEPTQPAAMPKESPAPKGSKKKAAENAPEFPGLKS